MCMGLGTCVGVCVCVCGWIYAPDQLGNPRGRDTEFDFLIFMLMVDSFLHHGWNKILRNNCDCTQFSHKKNYTPSLTEESKNKPQTK